MVKNLGYKPAILGCALSCLLSVAYTAVAETGENDDVVFATDTKFGDVACNGDPRDVVYTLQNNEVANLRLHNIRLTPFKDDNSGITTVLNTTGCVTDITTEGGAGVINSLATCEITFTVTPPSCVEGPTSNDIIHRELFLNIASQQEGLTQEVHARVTVIGSGREFSVLDINNPPETNQALGHSQLFGDLGILSAPWLKENQDGFEVIAGTIYTTASPTTDAAHSDFLAAYNTLRDVWDDDGCREHGSIDNGDAVQPGYYCLSYQNDDGEPIDVTLSGEVLLEGPGNFIFFIGAGQEPEELCGDDLNPRMCDLIVRSTARFTYKNASPQDVYWVLLGDFELEPIMGKTFATPVAANYSNVYLSANSTLHGTVLAGAPGSSDGTSFDQGGLATITAEGWDFPVTGNGGAVVHGRLWAYSAFDEDDPMPAIRLASTTVDAHAID